jgi:predicted phosphoribosyltransferase
MYADEEDRMTFKNRKEAAYLLAERLEGYRGQTPLVLAIPRGGVVMGYIIANALGGELDVVLVHKLRDPNNLQLAIGAVDEVGHVHLSQNALAARISEEYIETEKQVQMEVLHWRRAMYTGVRPPTSRSNRIVIVVDDGIVTGVSMSAALHTVRASSPARLIAAVAVVSYETVQLVEQLADEFVYLEVGEMSNGRIGKFFQNFAPVLDSDVIALLESPTARNR